MKKVLIGFAVILFLALVSLMALPYLFKDEIVAAVKQAANEELTAKVDFKDVDLSIFRHFPKLTVGLSNLEVTGTGPFEGTKLIQTERLDLAVDLLKALSGDVVVKGLYLKKPDVKIYVLSDGRANYDITKPAPPGQIETSTESAPIKLEHYALSDAKLLYDDRSLDMRAEMDGLNHEGSGTFTADLYDFVMETAVQGLSLNYGGVQYLSKAKTDWKATLGMDMKNMKFTFKENDCQINALKVNFDGWVQMPENTEDIRMDMTFGTPQNTFKSLLSIVPGAYTKDFEQVQANGTVQFAGAVKGTYNETTYPAFNLGFKVGNADFKYPSLPLGVSNINVDAAIKSPTQRLNDMTVQIPKFSLKIGSNPIEGYFNLKTPETDPTVDTRINGVLNLAELSKAFPVEGVEELAGVIKANIIAKAAMSQVEKQLYDQVNMSGDFAMSGITYRAAGTPTVKIKNLSTSLTPQQVNIADFDAQLGKSDLKASGKIDNVLAYFSTTKTMRGDLNFSSNYFDANEWMEPAPADGSKVPTDVPPAGTASEKVFDRWDFNVDGRIGKLKYDVYDLSALQMKGHFTPNKMDVADFALKINGNSDLSGNGQIANAWNYLFDNQTVSGAINLNSTYFDLNPFMEEAPATSSTATQAAPPAEGVIPVPENMDMRINANFAKIKYTTYDLNNLQGAVVVKDEEAKLEDCTANILGGKIGLSGAYDTRDASKPLFNMDMALQDMGFREAFNNFVTIKTLAPIAQFMDGKFNTTLSMSGILGKDMTPDFNTLNAAGFLETIHAVISNFKPFSTIGDKLNVEYLKKLDIANTRNWFEVKNGAVSVKPFDLKVKDLAMKIGGSHSISNDMNYDVITKVPRKLLEQSGVGAAANTGLKLLSSEASKVGVSIAQGEYINVLFNLTGNMFSPKVGMKVLGSDGQASIQEQATASMQATVDKAKDSLARVADKKLQEAKDKAVKTGEKVVDTLGKVAEKKVNEAIDKGTDVVKDKVGEKVGEAVGTEAQKKAEEVMGDKGKKTVEDVKGKLDKWDPFKKKKN